MAPDARPPPDELALHLERVLPAPPEAAFRAHALGSELAKWFGPHDFQIPNVELDLRPGGAYRIAMQPPNGEVFYLSGEIREVIEPERLVYTFAWEDPTPDDTVTTVTITLRGTGDSTTMTVDQRPFATPERLALHTDGWSDSLDKLGALLAATRS